MNRINSTATGTVVGFLLCPSDPGPEGPMCNYRGNTGVGPNFRTSAEYPDSGNGLFSEVVHSLPAFVPDGLSHTVAMSERVLGGDGGSPDPDRDFFSQPANSLTADDLIKACRVAAQPGRNVSNQSGSGWFWVGRDRTLYTHTQAPNGRVPDCLEWGVTPPAGMMTARSWHGGGVNVLMADGSTRFMQDSVDLHVWRSLGTRNGRELVD
jgi:prepilin-type processing-associated H-X9-DG protein